MDTPKKHIISVIVQNVAQSIVTTDANANLKPSGGHREALKERWREMKITKEAKSLIRSAELHLGDYETRTSFDAGDDSNLMLSNNFYLRAIVEILKANETEA